jgi:hypothetical protein
MQCVNRKVCNGALKRLNEKMDTDSGRDSSLRVSESLRRDIKVEASAVGVPMYRLLEIAWDLYKTFKFAHPEFGKRLDVVDAISHNKINSTEINAQEWQWADKLLSILRSGHSVANEAVTRNLEAFARLVEVDQAKNEVGNGSIRNDTKPNIGAGTSVPREDESDRRER